MAICEGRIRVQPDCSAARDEETASMTTRRQVAQYSGVDLGNAMSGAPICNGGKVPKAPTAGGRRRDTMIVPCIAPSWL